MSRVDLNKRQTGTQLGGSKQHVWSVENLGDNNYRFETTKRMTPYYIRADKRTGLFFIHNTVRARLAKDLDQSFTSAKEAIKALVKFCRKTKQTHESKRYWHRVRTGYQKAGEVNEYVKPRFDYKTNRK